MTQAGYQQLPIEGALDGDCDVACGIFCISLSFPFRFLEILMSLLHIHTTHSL